ncbi:molybdopterin converting factor subunit 1 [Kistimonas asteriae]|uniref:molybdopterin converting factor subunit 1 n=1 Tax=Kistimonas asteriae TaxID=517724 RepID=UPI001BA94D71|nr:molybdopterin converting factor subunit 1 [Kistimonas asteriae]
MIKVLFFAGYRERLGCDALELETSATTIDALKAQLAERGDLWRQLLQDRKTHTAINQAIVTDPAAEIHSGDEVAFFPPVTGG